MATEKRLIDVNAFRDYWNKNYRHQYANETFLFALANFPTVDAVPVVHGHWEWHGGDDDCMVYGFCSNCYNSYEEDLAMVYKYCPNCGAHMDLEVKDA